MIDAMIENMHDLQQIMLMSYLVGCRGEFTTGFSHAFQIIKILSKVEYIQKHYNYNEYTTVGQAGYFITGCKVVA